MSTRRTRFLWESRWRYQSTTNGLESRRCEPSRQWRLIMYSPHRLSMRAQTLGQQQRQQCLDRAVADWWIVLLQERRSGGIDPSKCISSTMRASRSLWLVGLKKRKGIPRYHGSRVRQMGCGPRSTRSRALVYHRCIFTMRCCTSRCQREWTQTDEKQGGRPDKHSVTASASVVAQISCAISAP